MDEQQAIEKAVSAAHHFIGSYGYGGNVFTAGMELSAALEGMALAHEQRKPKQSETQGAK